MFTYSVDLQMLHHNYLRQLKWAQTCLFDRPSGGSVREALGQRGQRVRVCPLQRRQLRGQSTERVRGKKNIVIIE